jgi:transposase, IS4 family
MGKTRDSKFLKIEIVMDNDDLNVINAEVTTNEVETAVKTVKDLQDKGKKVKKFYGKLMMLMRFTRPGLRLLSHLGRTLLLGVAILLGCKGVQEVIIVGGRRRVMVLGGGLSPYSLLYFWGIC